ncbi:PREDICTED: threo-3-hydroxyaspartate ammonia-lyase-like [Vollenhovia emeryi]|uniref:threo-3-hydroxyaspartate ammonia-lyase-like n=1 Tax=Vollenhovia emeryi TaxID=411798 RepID=UPI0005F3D2B3|nr:PREDICTED: threo-3-hydroxyaspartate ammonia-lyase-like [Vollenhovia emeryi]
MKKENNQIPNGIQARGVVLSLLNLGFEQKYKGVIAISRGYFARTLCYYGHKLQVPITIVLVNSSRLSPVKYCERLGGTILVAKNIFEAHKTAMKIAQQKGLVFLDGIDHPDMIIGQSTMAVDMLPELKTIDAVILPTQFDGCALTMGIAMVIKNRYPNMHIIEARIRNSDLFIEAIRSMNLNRTVLRNEEAKAYTWHFDNEGVLESLFDNCVIVDDHSAAQTFKRLTEDRGIDFTTTIGFAAILSGQLDYLKGRK